MPKPGSERIAIDGEEQVIGKDPRRMTAGELEAMGHERRSPLAALRAHCLDCCGGSPVEVRRCMALKCPSWPFRMGANPWREKRVLSEEQREAAVERLARARAEKSVL